jgi:endonuclease/exonuclease/phosphatase family metal-dependent hydrolase
VRLRVLTLNCWNISPPFDERMVLVRGEIERLAPDVIGLQEMIHRRDGFDQAAVVLEGLGYGWVFGAAFRWSEAGGPFHPQHADGDGFGNVVAARWPIVGSALTVLPGEEAGERRSVLATRIATPAGVLPFFTTHLAWKLDHGHVRERQVQAVADVVRAWANEDPLPPVLTGDLNAEPDSNEIRFLCGLAALGGRSIYFQDAWRLGGDGGPGHTWDNRNRYAAISFEPDRRIDYVLVGAPSREDGRGRVEAARLAFTEPAGEVFASDHFGVCADVRL